MSGIGGAAVALGADVATALYGVTGQSIKIGIISDSYDANGGAAANVAEGYLPNNVTVLSDSPGGTDEGQAMMELAYQIAPDATYYFASGEGGLDSCAAAVTALQNAGCNVIIDDLGFTDESFYQTGTPLDLAIQAAVASGVNYFSAAGNDGASYVQQGFNPLSVTIPGIGAVIAQDFGNGSPYLSVTIPRGADGNLIMQWAQPFASIGTGSAGAANSLAFYLLDAQGNVVASSTADKVGGDPEQLLSFTNDTSSTQFRLVVVQNGGTTPVGQNFIVSDFNSAVSIVSAAAGGGTGNILGHELLSDTNVVGAVTYSDTPAFGGTPVPAPYTSTGPGVILFDQNGNPLTTPVTPNSPTYTSASGSSTTVPGFETFNGTSAAAPNAGAVGALMLEANGALSTAQLTSLLAQSTIPVASNLPNTGAGLIQARAGVELANAAGGTLWSNAAGGDWNTAANWSGNALPDNSGAVMLGDDLGAITGSYTVTVDTAGDAAGSLTLSAPAGSAATLLITEGGALAVGGSAAANITAGDFLVAGRGTLTLDQGGLSVSGSLNSNDGTILLSAGQATADNFTQNAGTITVGSGVADAGLTLTGTGFSMTGGAATIDAGGTIETTNFGASAASLSIASGGTLSASGNATFINTTITEGGSWQSASLNVYGGAVDITTTGVVTTQSVAVGYSLAGTITPGSVTVNGQLVDQGDLGIGSASGAGSIAIGSTGTLMIGGGTSAVAISFLGQGGLLDFTSADSSTLTSALDALIYGFSADSGIIQFGALTYNPLDSYDYANGLLGIYLDGTNLANLALDPTLSYGGFAFSSGTDNALAITSIACFAAGTRIETARGAVPVEALTLGDRVRTAAGALQPVVWLGHRRVDCARHPEPRAVWPVRITAAAFGPGLPARDLVLSPDHAIFLEGVLIPIKYLIDGRLVRQEPRDRVTYFHVELPAHDILLAENLAAESYLDTGDRASFAGDAVTALHPDWGRARMDVALQMEAMGYAPLRVTGAEVDRARAALGRRAVSRMDRRHEGQRLREEPEHEQHQRRMHDQLQEGEAHDIACLQ